MKKLVTAFLIILFSSNLTYSQANDAEAMLYNVGFGGISGAVGAMINKKENEKLGKVALKGFLQGSLGGYVTFESKRILRKANNNNDWKLNWCAKIVNAGGTSIKENAALNQDFWEKWHLNIGFNRIEFNTKDKLSISYKIMPVALAYTAGAFFRFDFDPKNSLKYGEVIFKSNDLNGYVGTAIPGCLIYLDTPNYIHNQNNTITHEIIHLYQSNDFSVFNTYYQKPLNSWKQKNKTVNTLDKFLYVEAHYIPLRATYVIATNSSSRYYGNFLEHEAGFYSNTLQ